MANKSISQLDSAAQVSNDDLFETAVPDSGSATGYSSKKHSMAAVADHIANDVVYTGLQTTAQSIVGAVNELDERTEYEEVIIDTLNNGTIDTSRGGCYYRRIGRIVHLHLSIKDLTPETTTNVFTMPSGYRPPYASGMGVGIGASRDKRANVSVGASTGTCNLWSESATALIDFVYII